MEQSEYLPILYKKAYSLKTFLEPFDRDKFIFLIKKLNTIKVLCLQENEKNIIINLALNYFEKETTSLEPEILKYFIIIIQKVNYFKYENEEISRCLNFFIKSLLQHSSLVKSLPNEIKK